MKIPNPSSSELLAAIVDIRSLATSALAQALGQPGTPPSGCKTLSMLLDEERGDRGLSRRVGKLNRVLPFEAFAASTILETQVFASAWPPGILERLARLWRPASRVGAADFLDAILDTALSAPPFRRDMQSLAYRALRERILFPDGGLPPVTLSVPTLMAVVIGAGPPNKMPTSAWQSLEQASVRLAEAPDWMGEIDRLVLSVAAEAPGISLHARIRELAEIATSISDGSSDDRIAATGRG